MSKALLKIKEQEEIEFLKSKTYTEINVMFNELQHQLHIKQVTIDRLEFMVKNGLGE